MKIILVLCALVVLTAGIFILVRAVAAILGLSYEVAVGATVLIWELYILVP